MACGAPDISNALSQWENCGTRSKSKHFFIHCWLHIDNLQEFCSWKGLIFFHSWRKNVGYHDNQKLRSHHFTYQSEMTTVQWQCQDKPFNYSLEVCAALTHLNKKDYVSELPWRQNTNTVAIFNPSLKLDQDVLGPLPCLPAREIYITFKIYLDYK